MGFTAPQASKKTFDGDEASSQAPLPPPCFAGWSHSPAPLRSVVAERYLLPGRLALNLRQVVRAVAGFHLLRLAGELDGQALRRVGRHERQNIGHLARLDLGGDVEQHAAVEAVE